MGTLVCVCVEREHESSTEQNTEYRVGGRGEPETDCSTDLETET